MQLFFKFHFGILETNALLNCFKKECLDYIRKHDFFDFLDHFRQYQCVVYMSNIMNKHVLEDY